MDGVLMTAANNSNQAPAKSMPNYEAMLIAVAQADAAEASRQQSQEMDAADMFLALL